MEKPGSRLFFIPDRKTTVRLSVLSIIFIVLTQKLFGQYYENTLYVLAFVIAFLATLWYFYRESSKATSDGEPGLFEKRSVLSFLLLAALGYQLIFRIWDDVDYGSLSLMVLLVLFAAELFRKPFVQEIIQKAVWQRDEQQAAYESKEKGLKKGLAGGLLFTVFCFFMLEIKQPYFFTGDDNLVQFLPDVLLGVKTVLSGKFPAWNPYQHMGVPLIDQGIYALTYIPLYLSYFIANTLLGNENLILEVFAFLHLIPGFVVLYFLLRKMGISDLISSAGSTAYILSGFILMAGRSWFYMLPTAFYLPALAFIIYELLKGKPGLKWVVVSGVIIGLFFHAGNAQMWVYGLMFFGIITGLSFIFEKVKFSSFVFAAAAVTLGAAIAAPLAVPQYLVTKDLVRITWGEGVLQGVAAFIFPYPLCTADHPNGWASSPSNAQIYYSGTIFFLAAYLLFFFMLLYKTQITEMVRKNIWLFTGFIAFIFGLGKSGILWNLLSKQPVFSKFTNPFKFIPFINIFVIIGAAIIIEGVLNELKDGCKYRKFVTITVFALMFYHCLTPLNAFYVYADKPFGKMPEEVIKIVSPDGKSNYRIVSISAQDPFYLRSEISNLQNTAAFNYPTVFRLNSAGGYEPFAIDSPLYAPMRKAIKNHSTDKDFDMLRAFGVKWVFAFEQKCIDESEKNKNLKKVYKFPGQEIVIFELLNTNPVVFASKNPKAQINTVFDTQGAVIDTAGLTAGDEITVGVLARPYLEMSTGNNIIDFEKDNMGRIRFRMPENTNQVKLSYSPPWKKGFAASLLFFILTCALTVIGIYAASIEKKKEKLRKNA
ncbi:MAG: hypothetical protein LWY06_12090 [Firmicutes bacterium]|nr:hypothetical protein [Bacillota bacterium]